MADDAELLRRWNDGDAAAGEALFHRYFSALYRFFRSKAQSHCEELVQRTFAACVEKRRDVRDGGSFRAFVYAVARFELLYFFRRRAKDGRNVQLDTASAFDLDPSPSRVAADRQEHRLLLEALRRIPLDLQMVLELHYWEQLSTAELSQVLEIPQGTVKSRLRRAREAVAAALPAIAKDKALLQSTVDGFEEWVGEIKALFDDRTNP